MKGRLTLTSVLALGLFLALGVGLGQAQGPGPEYGDPAQTETAVAAQVLGSIPIQGRLTDNQGNPIDGSYSMTFHLYNSNSIEATALCTDTDTVDINDGLFSTYVSNCDEYVTGQQLYLGIGVGSDGEMEQRQPIYTVPYALGLRPGATINGEIGGDNVLSVRNSSTADGSVGLFGQAAGVSGETYGIYGASLSADGYGGRLFGGNGLYAEGITGVAVKAGGSGIIQSAANSYLWINGNSLQKGNSDDTTRFEFDSYGGYQVYGGADWGVNKTVVLPVTVFGQLYGQNVKVTGLDLYYTYSGDLTAITRVAMRRQNGVGDGNTIFTHDPDLVCGAGAQCTQHWDLTENNVLSDQQGILYIAMELGFAGENSYVQIGGVRLTLEHD